MATCEFENCSSVALLDDPDNYCFWHSLDPETIKKRLAGSSKGGKAGRKVLDPEHIEGLDLDELADLNRLLACLVGAVGPGESRWRLQSPPATLLDVFLRFTKRACSVPVLRHSRNR